MRAHFLQKSFFFSEFLENLIKNWRAHFQNVLNPLLMKIEFLASLYRITLELVTEWILDLDNSRK